MPIIRCSAQSSKTIEEFYQELINEEASNRPIEVGQAMLSFISIVNNTFVKTTLYGLTSMFTLNILRTDEWKGEWFISIISIGEGKFEFEYLMHETKSPWRNASIKGKANNIEEAKDFLIIAMKECGGWEDNKELRKLYYKLKARKTENPKFKLWLEFEVVDPDNWDIENEFCNIHVDLEDGRRYGLNVWTYKFFETSINIDKESGENLNGLYQTPPDLFVKELTRDCIEKAIEDLLKYGDLERVLNRSVYSSLK
jgi:hypothetical protein